jgi:hypothetical protein
MTTNLVQKSKGKAYIKTTNRNQLIIADILVCSLGQVKPSEAIDKSTAPKEVVLSDQRLNPAAGSGQEVQAVQRPAPAPMQREALPQLVSFYAQVQSTGKLLR